MSASRKSPNPKKLNSGKIGTGTKFSPGHKSRKERASLAHLAASEALFVRWGGDGACFYALHMLNLPYAQVGLLIQLDELAVLSVGSWTIIVEELGG